MDIKQLSVEELRNYFDLTTAVRDSILMMGRANGSNMSTPQLREINKIYNMLYAEVVGRLNSLYVGDKPVKETINEEVVH